MYTFGILAAFFLILSGIIFKGKIKENQFAVGLIVFAGTLIGSVIVNGVVGLDTDYTRTEKRMKELPIQTSKVIAFDDTLLYEHTYLQYVYTEELEKDGDTTLSNNYVDVGGVTSLFYQSELDREMGKNGTDIRVEFLPEGDSIPYYVVYKDKKVIDNKWVSPFGLPRGGRTFIAYIPNDSIHNVLMDQLNEKFYENETEKIAELN